MRSSLLSFLIPFLTVLPYELVGQDEPTHREIERFFIGVSGGTFFPIDKSDNGNAYKNMRSGSNYMFSIGYRARLPSMGGKWGGALTWGLRYSQSHANNDPLTLPYLATNYYQMFGGGVPLEFVLQEVRVNRYDITLVDVSILFGKHKEAYWHVGVDLILNQNVYFTRVPGGTNTTELERSKESIEEGLGGVMGFHIPFSDHFGITLDAGFCVPGYSEETNTFMTSSGSFVTNTASSSGFYGYGNIGLMYGIW